MTDNRKAVWGWVLYDWANSAFATTVMAGFFPVVFKQYWSQGTDINISTARLGFGNSAACLVVTIMAPVLGAIADKAYARKKFLIFFAYLGVAMTAALFLVPNGQWIPAIVIYVLGIIGFSGANVFYDALLPSVANQTNIDWISSLGFSFGYLGGGLLFLINVLIATMPETFGFSDTSFAVKFFFLMVAAWWGGFSVFMILWVPEDRSSIRGVNKGKLIAEGFRQFVKTLKKIRRLKTAFLFLIAYWFYIDGVGTIIKMAVDYGLSLGFSPMGLIVALLIVQFVGFPAAIGFSQLSRWIGVRSAIFLGISVYLMVTLSATQMTHQNEFYILAVAIGLVQGGIQALSRSYFFRLIPLKQAGEFYGFYNMIGKLAAILGPTLIGLAGLFAR
jgi:UMF1 family MFS transporter